MADEDSLQRQMSLIPYSPQNGEIVLRRGNAVVVYDSQSHQLSVRDAPEQTTVDLTDCPYCHRPLREDAFYPEDQPEEQRPRSGRPFMDPNYFRMLAEEQKRSQSPSAGPSTSRRGFFQPAALRSGRSRDVSGAQDPPADAEFVGSEPSAAARQGISSEAFNQGYFKRFFKELGPLGKGGNGVVMLVEHIMDGINLGPFACKRIPVGDDHAWLEKVLVEVTLLQKVTHPNLVAYHWVWLEHHQPSTFGPSIPCLWMLQEHCNGGDLHRHVLGPPETKSSVAEALKKKLRRRSKGEVEPSPSLRGPSKLTFDEIFSFFRDITSGLHHLHTKGYLHRDLKPANCLLKKEEGSRTRVLISDFGEVQAAGAERMATGATGTISYCAPEVLLRDANGNLGDFTIKSDIFSLGMIVYFMCFGRLPYASADDMNEENEDLDELRDEITKWTGFDDQTRARTDLPDKLFKYLKRLLSVDPNERPSTDEILASIKGGVGLGEASTTVFEDNSPRISSLDPPKSRTTRKQPAHGRPGSFNLRHNSFDTCRPLSPVRRTSDKATPTFGSQSNSRPQSPPSDGTMMPRPRNIDIPPPPSVEALPSPKHHDQQTPRAETHQQLHQTPRLMLPPPPSTPLIRILTHPTTSTVLRTTFFALKLLTLTLPCSPYAPNPWLLYPLLALATLDVGVWEFDVRRGGLLLGLHFAVVWWAERGGRACEGLAWGRF